MNRPDQWVVIKIEKEGIEPLYKIFASWMGGYLDGDSWRMNSGIVRIEEEGGYYKFYGESGSCYDCVKQAYGTGTSYTSGVLNTLVEKASEVGGTVTILDKDTNWLNMEEYGI